MVDLSQTARLFVTEGEIAASLFKGAMTLLHGPARGGERLETAAEEEVEGKGEEKKGQEEAGRR